MLLAILTSEQLWMNPKRGPPRPSMPDHKVSVTQLYQMPPWSGLQKDVLSLYRRALRMARSKPPASQPKFRLFVRFTFHMNASKVSPRNVSFIEHLLRKGVRQIEAYEDPAVKDCWVSEEMVSWDNDMRMAVQRKST